MGPKITEEKMDHTETHTVLSWDDVRKHTDEKSKWFVIENKVYDITRWSKKHPGGNRIISHYAGQDATEAFRAFHNDLGSVKKYLNPLEVGKLREQDAKPVPVKEDFEALRQTAENMGLFKSSVLFYVTNVGHLVALEVLAYLTLMYFGTGWLPYIIAVSLYGTMQAQAGWSQHDYGHISVFPKLWMNKVAHHFTMSFLKGASCDWWNNLHYQHHAKPNVLNKDPDVRLDALFVVGEEQPKQVAKRRKTLIPYHWQHCYFFAIGPPLLFPVYFQIMIFRHAIIRKKYMDLIMMLTFYAKILLLYSPLLGVLGAIKYYMLVRCIESHWFVWVSQSNHIPMEIDDDKNRSWVPLQLHATCNVEHSWFNDWFTGHLNFQIEHHLFPRMPRHNLYKIAPLAKALCEKHGVTYEVKTLGRAFLDIVKSLKNSGEIWKQYNEAYHLDLTSKKSKSS